MIIKEILINKKRCDLMYNGNEKKLIGLVVEDEPGVLQRIAGLFSRRGFNLDTIIVGKTTNKGKSHIVISVKADEKTLEQIEKQVNKIVDVIKVVNYNEEKSIIREHCLVKINSNAKIREDILNFVKMFEAKVLDANKDELILELASYPKKIDDFLEALTPFGIKESSRTGINALQKK